MSSTATDSSGGLCYALASKNAATVSIKLMSQGIVANGLVFTSGATGKDPATHGLVEGSIKARTHRCIQNLGAVLKDGGSSGENVIEVSIFLTDMAQYGRVNSAYEQYWGEPKPARTCVAMQAIPENTDIEIKCIGLKHVNSVTLPALTLDHELLNINDNITDIRYRNS